MNRPIISVIPNADSPLNEYLFDRAMLSEWRAIQEFVEDRAGNIDTRIEPAPETHYAVHDVLIQVIRAREAVERRIARPGIPLAIHVDSASTGTDSTRDTPSSAPEQEMPPS